MNKFEKVSKAQFEKDVGNLPFYYGYVRLPLRATQYSAGYDFFAPGTIRLAPGESIKFPSGIRALLDSDKFLAILPRSGYGFKYRLQLDNTIGVIDADYSKSDNTGHIWVKLTNDSREDKELYIKHGEAYAQGIILPYYKTDDDNTIAIRNGGLGSTTTE